MMTTTGRGHRTAEGNVLRGILLLAGACLASYGALTIIAIHASLPWGTTDASVSPAATAADIAAGVGLIVTGMLIAWAGAGGLRGFLVTLAGVVWFASDWIGWQGQPVARSVAAVAQPFFLPIVLHIVIITPGARRASGNERALVAVAYLLTVIASLILSATYDPMNDRVCWRNCTDNSLLVRSLPPLAEALRGLLEVGALAIGGLIVGICLRRAIAITSAARRALWPVFVPAAMIGAVAAVHAAVLLMGPIEEPQTPVYAGMFVVFAWTVVAFSCGLAWLVIRSRHIRATIASLIAELSEAPKPGDVAGALARALGDPTVRLIYRLDRPERWVDGDGLETQRPMADAGLVSMSVIRDGEVVALVCHDPQIANPLDLERHVGPAARLAIENGRSGGDPGPATGTATVTGTHRLDRRWGAAAFGAGPPRWSAAAAAGPDLRSARRHCDRLARRSPRGGDAPERRPRRDRVRSS